MRQLILSIALSIVSICVHAEGQGDDDSGGLIDQKIPDPSERVIQEMLRASHSLPEQLLRESFRQCDRDNLTLRICASYRLTEQDLRLNHVYSRLLQTTKNEHTDALLIKAERAWLGFRDAQCEFEGAESQLGGTMPIAVVADCKADLTERRAESLEALTRP
ncbi:MAG TPA: lysozyme inhibitor LprI family protein [Burkholderiaceae bacterium]